jgi:N-acetyl-1-D-myo-inositol-2-amino-2-deoxy-alpha-D-glucopyranoside deacetylase
VHTVPDEKITTRLDVTPWLETKVAAVVAHRTEVERGALPALIAGLPPDSREKPLSTEWYLRWRADSPTGTDTELTLGP